MINSWIFADNCNRDNHIICKRAPDVMEVASLAKSSDVFVESECATYDDTEDLGLLIGWRF